MEKEISIANDSVWKKSENYSSKESITRDEVRKQTKILDEKLFKLRYNEAQYFNDAPLRAIDVYKRQGFRYGTSMANIILW